MPDVGVHGDVRCPKRMVYGPCGGVRADLSCEMAPGAVPVRRPAGGAVPGPAGPRAAVPARLLAGRAGRPVVLTDLTVPPVRRRRASPPVARMLAASLRRAAGRRAPEPARTSRRR